MSDKQDSTLTFVKASLDSGWDALVEEAKRFVKKPGVIQLSQSQLNQLRNKADKANTVKEIKCFIKRQAERDEQRRGQWTRIKPSLESQFAKLPEQVEELKKDLLNFAETEVLSRLRGELKDYFNSKDANLQEQLKLELTRRFFTAVYAICRVQRNGIEFKI